MWLFTEMLRRLAAHRSDPVHSDARRFGSSLRQSATALFKSPNMRGLVLLVAASLCVVSCGGAAKLPLSAGIGSRPVLPPPETSLFPVLLIAPAKGWPAGQKPVAADGLAVAKFADALDHPRWLYVLPGGGGLIAESNAAPRRAAPQA